MNNSLENVANVNQRKIEQLILLCLGEIGYTYSEVSSLKESISKRSRIEINEEKNICSFYYDEKEVAAWRVTRFSEDNDCNLEMVKLNENISHLRTMHRLYHNYKIFDTIRKGVTHEF